MLVTFKIKHALTKPGEKAFMVGNSLDLGNWINNNALNLTTNPQEYPCWTSEAPIEIKNLIDSKAIKYKYIVMNEAKHTFWENGNENRQVDLSSYFPQFMLKDFKTMTNEQIKDRIEKIQLNEFDLCYHVTVEDEAFHNLSAVPNISVKKNCDCKYCLSALDRLLQNMEKHVELAQVLTPYSQRVEEQQEPAISLQQMKAIQNQFNLHLKDIFIQNQDVISKIKSNQFGQENLIDNVGTKCFHYFKLKHIQYEEGLFDLPPSVCVPMTVPVHFAIKEAAIYKRIKSIFKQIDNSENDLELQQSLIHMVKTVLNNYGKTIDLLVKYIVDQMSQAGVYTMIMRPSPTLPFLNQLQQKDFSNYPEQSLINVQNTELIKQAISKVWLSGYSQQAIAFRKQNGIASYHAQMSILVQEQIQNIDYKFKLNIIPNASSIGIEIWGGDEHKCSDLNQVYIYQVYSLQTGTAQIIKHKNSMNNCVSPQQDTSASEEEVNMTQIGGRLGAMGQVISKYFDSQIIVSGALTSQASKIYVLSINDKFLA